LSDDHLLREIHLPRHKSEVTQTISAAARTLEDMERSYIIEVLKRCRGKISGAGGAAEILEVPGTTLHSKMKKLSISKADYFLK
jgi:DNA-binding NtrC family response regulator